MQVDERSTSTTCSVCDTEDVSQRVERGFFGYEVDETVANSDINGGKPIRQQVLPSIAPDGGVEIPAGWHSQQSTRSLVARAAPPRANRS